MHTLRVSAAHSSHKLYAHCLTCWSDTPGSSWSRRRLSKQSGGANVSNSLGTNHSACCTEASRPPEHGAAAGGAPLGRQEVLVQELPHGFAVQRPSRPPQQVLEALGYIARVPPDRHVPAAPSSSSASPIGPRVADIATSVTVQPIKTS